MRVSTTCCTASVHTAMMPLDGPRVGGRRCDPVGVHAGPASAAARRDAGPSDRIRAGSLDASAASTVRHTTRWVVRSDGSPQTPTRLSPIRRGRLTGGDWRSSGRMSRSSHHGLRLQTRTEVVAGWSPRPREPCPRSSWQTRLGRRTVGASHSPSMSVERSRSSS